MAFNGSGVFQRLYNWVTDAANGIDIKADRMDAEMDGFATGLSLCLTRDGQAAMTANLRMGGFAITGLKDPEADQDAATKKFVTSLIQGQTPSGGIIMWAGSIVAIPAGWRLCDGTNGTPDLRSRFVVGAGTDYAVNDVGGAKEVILSEAQMPQHSHAVALDTSAAGAHGHTAATTQIRGRMSSISETWAGSGSASGVLAKGTNVIGTGTPQNTDNSSTGSMDLNADHTHTLTEAPAHTHAVSGNTSEKGSSSAHENRPPYYALAYIMKS
jgi:microcystin-dependent protein